MTVNLKVTVATGLKNPITKYNKQRRAKMYRLIADELADAADDMWRLSRDEAPTHMKISYTGGNK